MMEKEALEYAVELAQPHYDDKNEKEVFKLMEKCIQTSR